MNSINLKIDIIMKYINDHNINNKILDSNNHNTYYTINDLLLHHFVYEHFCRSYNAYEEILKLFCPLIDHPSRSRINKFIIKLSKMQIFKKAFEYHNKNLIIDSSFIPNSLMSKQSDCIGVNSYYKNKFGWNKLKILLLVFSSVEKSL